MDSKQVLKNVVDLSMSTVEISIASANILTGTREVQSAATSMASAVEELAASISEIGSSAERTSSAVQESSHLTHEGMRELLNLKSGITATGDVFQNISQKTKDLQESVSSLSKVVDLISKIAGQTNLLALNATIEAARAGEHGKGFAVVASEVKSLSRQTSEATDTIRTQISQLVSSFSDVLASVDAAQGTVSSVIENTEKVEHDFERINTNSSSISQQATELASIISQQEIAVKLLAENMHVVKAKGETNLEAVDKLAERSDQSVKLIEDWRAQLAQEDIEDKVVYLAQADHLLWKKRLLDMAIGRSNMKASDLTDHTLCRLGKWYYQQADEKLRSKPSFAAIEEPHKLVHHHGIEAAKLFEAHKMEEGMAHYHKLEEASALVISRLQGLLNA
jgi:methyl-accepting chemotaxis protein